MECFNVVKRKLFYIFRYILSTSPENLLYFDLQNIEFQNERNSDIDNKKTENENNSKKKT